jgi:hypothetical protein
MESFTSTSDIGTIRDIVEDPREGVKDRIDKTNWTLSNSESFFIKLHDLRSATAIAIDVGCSQEIKR